MMSDACLGWLMHGLGSPKNSSAVNLHLILFWWWIASPLNIIQGPRSQDPHHSDVLTSVVEWISVTDSTDTQANVSRRAGHTSCQVGVFNPNKYQYFTMVQLKHETWDMLICQQQVARNLPVRIAHEQHFTSTHLSWNIEITIYRVAQLLPK